ncbi:MAG: GTP-binding protein [Oceanospirillaceae bacterium]|nr:GTP-binding protein [Oceanospirillaceae bacterium]
MSAERCHPIPLTVIGGFLGAGKTSYLNGLIRDGLEPGSLILVNDFGSINIDSELIEYQDDRLISLSNGCACCTLGGTLAEQLAEAMRFSPRPTAVYIEASGVADTARIADVARVSPNFRPGEVLCLIDASQALANARHPQIGEAWRNQVRAASRLLINRQVDDDTHRARVTVLLDELNPDAKRIELPLPEGAPVPVAAPSKPVAATPRALVSGRHPWTSVTLDMVRPVDPAIIDQLLEENADVLVRAKGFVTCHDRSVPRLLQFSGRHPQWQSSLHTPAKPQLVLIGISGQAFDALCCRLRALGSMD